MATNTAFGTLASPITQLFGGNAGGGVAGAAPQRSRTQTQPTQGLAPGTSPTFAQLQQQGQARPAPAAGTAAPAQQQQQQPPMLSALSTQLAQPAQQPAAQQPAASQGLDKLPANIMEQLNANVSGWSDGGYVQGGMGNTMFKRDAEGNTTIDVRDESGGSQRYSNVAAQPEQPQQYAQAQSAGYQSSGEFGGSSQAQALRSRLEQQLNDLSQNEAQIQGQSYAALRKAKMDEMGAEFGAQRSQLEEDLARRGLSASTIGGGRYGDLAGQQARATASFEADLLKQQAEAEAENRKVYLSGMSELAGMAGQQDLGAFEANLKSRQADADISLRTQELQQKAALEGRSLNLQEARDLATKEYQGGQLQQGYAEISSRERMSASDIAARQQMQQSQFGFDKEQSALERSLRETMQTRQLTSEEKRQLDQITANKDLQTNQQTFQAGQNAANNAFQAGQSQLERDLRAQLQAGQITADGQRQLAQIEANKSLQESQQTWQSGQTAAGNVFQAAQSQLDRDLRTTLSANELGQAKAQFDQRFGLEKGQSDNQFLASLAQALAPMKQADRDAFLASLGIKKPSPTAPGSPSTNTGGF